MSDSAADPADRVGPASGDTGVLRIAIDSGGTFTDAVATDGRRIFESKVDSTPDDPARAVVAAATELAERFSAAGGSETRRVLIHGTTVATNALLQRRGARTAFVTNTGFEDLLRIGRQHRRELFSLEPAPRPTLVPPERCFGVAGRRDHRGRVVEALDTTAFEAALASLDEEALSWAVCLLHSYADGSDERAVAEVLRRLRPDDHVSLSSDLLPVFREVERANTTVANAFVRPLIDRYLGRLRGCADQVEVMGSAGGRLGLSVARRHPVQTALSGPAGGVVAAMDYRRRAGVSGVIAFDMGGTSTDVALCTDELPMRFSAEIGGFSLHIPTLDIHTVGAGGGSIARVDAGGALVVGPESAGADPGPAAYGRGDAATVTDANIVAGCLPADTRLGGHRTMDAARAHRAVAAVANAAGMTVAEAAQGIRSVAIETMARAIRRISVERGIDPRQYPLCVYGGAGGLHACELAERLSIREVHVPPRAGLFSAVGMLIGAPMRQRSRTVIGLADSEIVALARQMVSEVLSAATPDVELRADLRYRGQSYELGVPLSMGGAGVAASPHGIQALSFGAAREAFAAEHMRRFGYTLDGGSEGSGIEVVTLRARAFGAPAPLPPHGYSGGATTHGPASIVAETHTIWVAPGWSAVEGDEGAFVLRRQR